ncbi:MAG: transposase [Rhodospirillales bacterium]|nr:transposase [Rhodospirillales bacterium]
MADARRTIEEWWIYYYTQRSHSSLGYMSPIEYVRQNSHHE